MKKQRGLKRYYQNLAIKNDFEKWEWFNFAKNPNSQLNHWHWHFDWKGFGNLSFKRRKPHLDKLFRHFELLAEETGHLKSEFQLFILLLDFNSSSDAIYIHTPSSNHSEFPIKWTGLSQVSTLTNTKLYNYIEHQNGYEKLYGKAEEAFCILYRKGVGNPIDIAVNEL